MPPRCLHDCPLFQTPIIRLTGAAEAQGVPSRGAQPPPHSHCAWPLAPLAPVMIAASAAARVHRLCNSARSSRSPGQQQPGLSAAAAAAGGRWRSPRQPQAATNHRPAVAAMVAQQEPAAATAAPAAAAAATDAEADLSSALSLANIRQTLIRLEDTIIFSLIERAQFARNEAVYAPDAIPVPGYAASGRRYSLLEYLLREMEQVGAGAGGGWGMAGAPGGQAEAGGGAPPGCRPGGGGSERQPHGRPPTHPPIAPAPAQVHGRIRRYTSPDEYPFFPEDLPPLVLPPITYDNVRAAAAALPPCSACGRSLRKRHGRRCVPPAEGGGGGAAAPAWRNPYAPTHHHTAPPPCPQVLHSPALVNINSSIMDMYLEHLLPEITAPGDDHNYGSSAMHDVTVLQVRTSSHAETMRSSAWRRAGVGAARGRACAAAHAGSLGPRCTR